MLIDSLIAALALATNGVSTAHVFVHQLSSRLEQKAGVELGSFLAKAHRLEVPVINQPLSQDKDVDWWFARRGFQFREYWGRQELTSDQLTQIAAGNMAWQGGGETMLRDGVPISLFETHPEYFPLVSGKRDRKAAEKQMRRCLSNHRIRLTVEAEGEGRLRLGLPYCIREPGNAAPVKQEKDLPMSKELTLDGKKTYVLDGTMPAYARCYISFFGANARIKSVRLDFPE